MDYLAKAFVCVSVIMEYLTKVIVCLVIILFSGYGVWYLYNPNTLIYPQVFAKVETHILPGFETAYFHQNLIRNSSENHLIKYSNAKGGQRPPQKPIRRSVHAEDILAVLTFEYKG